VSWDTGDGRETEVGDAGPLLLVDQDVRLCRWLRCKCGDIPFGRQETYAFQVSVDHAEVMHVFQAVRDAGQLNGTSVGLLRDQVTTYQLAAVYTLVPPDEVVDVSIFHPLGNKSKPVLVQCHPKQR